MLFLLDRADADALKFVPVLGGDADRELLLISDGVYLAREGAAVDLAALGFDSVYADDKAVADRGLDLVDDCEAVSCARIVDIVLDNEKVINI
ncbi:sulfur transfer complex TusBCD TusB component (DsrH family) [Desulfobaculum xiamenense]|uniref:Sulfur transfer complex TusBCD TusB component (DsrH family) n=1 Tax=Desulfobaculum xiamenense TaxID=995050 RepID=A0A846QLT6_9BACT|nr:hypothetical protein [Desulfobaculum xiamenense]NJB67990.1 sulfur transfer complex TusBCD TusB component (DsrH family) [Desulfobaculum xiamenense]